MEDSKLFLYSGIFLIIVGIGIFIGIVLFKRWRQGRIDNGVKIVGKIIGKDTYLRRYMNYLVKIEYDWQGITRKWDMQLSRKEWKALSEGDEILVSLPIDAPNKLYPVDISSYSGGIIYAQILGGIFLFMGAAFVVLGILFYKGLIS